MKIIDEEYWFVKELSSDNLTFTPKNKTKCQTKKHYLYCNRILTNLSDESMMKKAALKFRKTVNYIEEDDLFVCFTCTQTSLQRNNECIKNWICKHS